MEKNDMKYHIKDKIGGEKMNYIFYILIIIGAVMVYGAGRILKLFNRDNSVKSIIIMKFAGLIIALIGMLKILNVY